MADLEPYSVTIASGTSLSPAMPLGFKVPIGIWMPAAWTAAALTFQVSPDGGTTWLELYDALGNEVTVQVAAGNMVQLTPDLWGSASMVKIRSGTAAAAVNQGADRIINMMVRTVGF